MKNSNVICNFFISNKFEAINFTHGLNSFIDFELLGISDDESKYIGNLFLDIFNNFDTIINTLEECKNHLDEPLYVFLDYIYKTLSNINKSLSEIIAKELENYQSNEISDIRNTQSNLKHIQKELKEHETLLNNTTLYNKYYDDLIAETKERIKILKSQEEINSEKDFLNDLCKEKKDTKKGKNSIQSIIQDLKDEEEQSLKELRNLNELPSLMDKYISRLINTITNYKYYFDMYYGILEEADFKNKDISYFQSIFGLDFEIPRHIIYASYEEYGTFFPLKKLMFSIYDNAKSKKEKLTDTDFYQKILNETNTLNNKGGIIYLKSYEINNLKDILSIYFNFFIQENICIRKCANCGKYFIPVNRTDEKYCDNPSPQNLNKTCKEYGAKKIYRDKLNSNEVKKAHYTTSQFFRMKIKRAKTEKEIKTYTKLFDLYKSNYEKQKKKFNNKRISESDFIDWIVNQKNLDS